MFCTKNRRSCSRNPHPGPQKYQILVPKSWCWSQKYHILGPSNCFYWGAADPQTLCCSLGASTPQKTAGRSQLRCPSAQEWKLSNSQFVLRIMQSDMFLGSWCLFLGPWVLVLSPLPLYRKHHKRMNTSHEQNHKMWQYFPLLIRTLPVFCFLDLLSPDVWHVLDWEVRFKTFVARFWARLKSWYLAFGSRKHLLVLCQEYYAIFVFAIE